MRSSVPSFLLTPDAFTRGEGIGVPLPMNGGWPPGAQEAFALGASLAFDERAPSTVPDVALLHRRLDGNRLDRFLAQATPDHEPPSRRSLPGRPSSGL